jgi:hypothetical protein
MRDATTAQPRTQAFFDDPPPTPSPRPPGADDPAAAARWDDLHSRWTVHLSNELIEAIKTAARETGQSRASLAEAALRADPTIAAYL